MGELEEIKANKDRKSKKHISRELDITFCMKTEREEYDNTGFGTYHCLLVLV